ncbi:hypothetical protein ACHAPI_012010 [Fusarium lateritium]
MTSYERDSRNAYAGVKEPKYNAISYTWGRFEDKSQPALEIKGVAWKIPGIVPRHFTVQEFQTAINCAVEEREFLWLDVACIDQENNAVKMDEINKQAVIFQRAESVYAWLTPWSTTQMMQSLYALENFTLSLGFGLSGYKYKPSIAVGLVHSTTARDAVADIAAQGWFTSLWTLQEAWLSYPFIMSRSAHHVKHVHYEDGKESGVVMPDPVSLFSIVGHFANIWLARHKEQTPESRSLCEMIVNTGLLSMYTRKEALLYIAAAKRQHRLPQDAVYGIMQVYDIRMPASDDFERLFNDFNVIINAHGPVDSQLFVHTQPAKPFKEWRVTRETIIPDVFQYPGTSHHDCTVEFGSRHRPLFTGLLTGARSLFHFWERASTERLGSHKPPFLPHIYLDASVGQAFKFLQVRHPGSSAQPQALRSLEEPQVITVCPDSIGRHMPGPLVDYHVLFLGRIKSEPESLDIPDTEQWAVTHSIGLLIYQPDKGLRKPWQRAGYCSWISECQSFISKYGAQTVVLKPDVVETPSSMWTKSECYLG